MIHFLFVLLTFCFAETTTPANAPAELDEKQRLEIELQNIKKDIEDHNKNLACEKLEDCDSVALGARACGGPEDYLVISKRNQFYRRIQLKAQKHVKLSVDYKKYRPNMMSICSVVMPSALACLNKICQEVPQ